MTAPSHLPNRPAGSDPPAAPAAPPDRPAGPPTAGPGTGTARRALLGRPEDPRWARPGLWAVLILAGVLYGWSLSANGMANSYYAAAVQAGTQSWKAFFFGSLDAASFITVDKPPLALWVMALSARVFGFSSWSMLLPQAVAGVAAAAVLHSTVRSAFGEVLGAAGAHAAALVSALVLALTPITVAINRDNNPDTMLVLLLVLAAWALQRAVATGRLRPLLLSAVLVGMAFNTKMLQAYVALPALALAYLICGPGTGALRGPARRVGHLLLAGVVLAVSSFWWMLIVDRWPARSRPYVGGSTDNTVWDLVIGYNGLGRVFGGNGPGGTSFGGQAGSAGAIGRAGGGPGFGGQAGAGRLFNEINAGQISWLIPFAVIALIIGLILLRRRPRTDPARASLLIWGGWLAVHWMVFSFAQGVFHPYYSTALAPAIGALTGAGGVLMWQAHRRSARWAWALPAALVVTAGWSFTLLRRTPDWHSWLPWAVAAMSGLAVLLLAAARLPRRPGAEPGLGRLGLRLLVTGAILGLVAALAGPSAYAVSAARSRTNGTNPLAGPSTGMGFGGPGGAGGPGGMRWGPRGGTGSAAPGAGFPGGAPGGAPGAAMPGGLPGGPGGGRDGADAQLIAYLKANQGSATWLVAVGSAQAASSIMLQTARPVIAMGGFTGSDPAMTTGKLQAYVASGKLRFILLGGGRGPGGGADSQVTAWVQRNCTAVPSSAHSGDTSSSAGSSSSADGSGAGSATGGAAANSGANSAAQQLYRCG